MPAAMTTGPAAMAAKAAAIRPGVTAAASHGLQRMTMPAGAGSAVREQAASARSARVEEEMSWMQDATPMCFRCI
jgi:hypothetical protein